MNNGPIRILLLGFALSGCAASSETDGGEPQGGGRGGDHAGGAAGVDGQAGAGNSSGGDQQAGAGGGDEAAGQGGGGGGGGGAGGEPRSGGTGGEPRSGGTGGSAGGTGGGAGETGGSGGSAGAGTGGGTPPPAGGLTPEQESAVISHLKTKVERVTGMRDGGHVVKLHLYTKAGADAPTSNLRDADLQKILGFNHLRHLEINHPNITEAGAQVIRQLPSLEFLGFQYMAKTNDNINPDFMLVANAHADRLKVVSLKHLFSVKGTSVHKLDVFPKLEYAVVDNASAGSECVTFLTKNASIVGLEIHRTTINGSQLAQIAKALPKLECLHLKKGGGTLSSGDVSKAFAGHPSLKVLYPHGISASVPGVKTVTSNMDYNRECRVSNLRPSDGPLSGSL